MPLKNCDKFGFKLNEEEGLKSKKGKIKSKRDHKLSSRMGSSHFWLWSARAYGLWRRAKFWVDSSPFLGFTCSCKKEEERKGKRKLS